MIRSDLITSIANDLKVSQREAKEFVSSFERCVMKALENDEEVNIYGFMKIEKVVRKGHIGRDFRTNTPMNIPARTVLKITPGNSMLSCLN